MVICPKCGKEIDCLKHYLSGEAKYDYDGKEYDWIEFQSNNNVIDYECPECSEVLFTDEDKAREFLLGKDGMTEKWKLSEWNNRFADNEKTPPMTKIEISDAILWLRAKGYPKPDDCPEQDCPKYRPACKIGVCRIAVGMCGDF